MKLNLTNLKPALNADFSTRECCGCGFTADVLELRHRTPLILSFLRCAQHQIKSKQAEACSTVLCSIFAAVPRISAAVETDLAVE